MKLHVVIASTRPGRRGPEVGAWFTRHAQAHGVFDVETVDLAALGLPFLDEPEHPSTGRYAHEHTRVWSRLVDEADAFAFVTPEYNYATPAPLKNALDFLYHEWAYKPVAFVSYGGTSAGTRGVQMTKQVVTTLRMYPLNAAVAIPTRQYLDADGDLRPDEALDGSARTVLDELARTATALSPLRAGAVH
ncbi:UNVERIFIED_ORG: NADPH-dependent oxidoreductase [Bacillus sp. AZ43]